MADPLWEPGLIVREAGADSELTIILLHGLGADMQDIAGVAEAMEGSRKVRWLFPNAPVRSVTLNGGALMRAWYDIYDFEGTAGEDGNGLTAMAGALGVLLAAERARSARPIVLGGFSQGGAMALYTALHARESVACVLALSAYLPRKDLLPAAAVDSPAIFMAHGAFDPIIPLDLARHCFGLLEARGYHGLWREYAMGHTIVDEELADAERFLWTARAAGRHGERT